MASGLVFSSLIAFAMVFLLNQMFVGTYARMTSYAGVAVKHQWKDRGVFAWRIEFKGWHQHLWHVNPVTCLQITLSSLSGPNEHNHTCLIDLLRHRNNVMSVSTEQVQQPCCEIKNFEVIKVSENNLFPRQVSVILWTFKGAHVMLVRMWLEAESGPKCRTTDGLRRNMNKQTGRKQNMNYMKVAWLNQRNGTDYGIRRRTNHMANTQSI